MLSVYFCSNSGLSPDLLWPGLHQTSVIDASRTSTRAIHHYLVSQNHKQSFQFLKACLPVEVQFVYLYTTYVCMRFRHQEMKKLHAYWVTAVRMPAFPAPTFSEGRNCLFQQFSTWRSSDFSDQLDRLLPVPSHYSCHHFH